MSPDWSCSLDIFLQAKLEWDVDDLFADLPNNASSESDSGNSRTVESPRGDFECCGQMFDRVSALRSHHEASHKRCHHCAEHGCLKSFTRKFALRRHIKAVHCRTKVMYCPAAGCAFAREGFTRRDIFLVHWKRQHQENNIVVQSTTMGI